MPERHYKPKSRYAPQLMMGDAAKQGALLKVKCTVCRRTRYFLAADLVRVFGDNPFYDWKATCSRCGTAEFVRTSIYYPEPGDAGSLEVRRPSAPETVIKWRTVKLGEAP